MFKSHYFTRDLLLGGGVGLRGGPTQPYTLRADDLCTHGLILGMTGSGKTGLKFVMLEGLLAAGIPVITIDIKGDLPNLLLSVPDFGAEALLPWVDTEGLDSKAALARASATAKQREEGLKQWNLGRAELETYSSRLYHRVLTPGSALGEPLHLLSSLERRSPLWDTNPEAASAALSAAVSLVLRLLGRDPDPAKSREHVLLTVLAERRLRSGQEASLGALLNDVSAQLPPRTPALGHVVHARADDVGGHWPGVEDGLAYEPIALATNANWVGRLVTVAAERRCSTPTWFEVTLRLLHKSPFSRSPSHPRHRRRAPLSGARSPDSRDQKRLG